jgi:hypothetical protein
MKRSHRILGRLYSAWATFVTHWATIMVLFHRWIRHVAAPALCTTNL